MAADPYKYFRIEARELVEQLAKGVLELERRERSPETIAGLLRLAHTLKGAARVVKQIEIAELAHAIEDGLAPFREGEAVAQRPVIDALLGQLDRIASAVAALGLPQEPGAPPRAPAEEPVRAVRVDVDEMESFFDAFAEAATQLAALRRNIAAIDEAARAAGQMVAQLSRARASETAVPPSVDALAGGLAELLLDLHRDARGSTERLGRELGELREAADRLRLVPASTLFAGLARTTRDAAQMVGRSARFESDGGDVRLDGHVLAIVQPALVQLVRNAIAHGIEPVAERVAADKPAEGLVRVEVSRHGNRISFVCRDDGRGIDIQALRGLVRRRGIADVEGEAQLIALLLRGGLSTSGAVTELSGRGVGLDVVREAASRLGGELRAHTERGRGASFELVVPVTMSSLEGLLVEAGGTTAVIPLDAVRRTVRVHGDDLVSAANGRGLLDDEGVVPFVPLAAVLHGDGARTQTTRTWSTVVVTHAGERAAIGVDRLLGTATVLQRPVPPLASVTDVVAGLALDDVGDPRIVLDPAALLAAAARPSAPTPTSTARARPRVLVVDDSLTTRMLEQAILESAGYEVELATSGEDGLARAREQSFELFLVDVEMPGMDGFTFVERTRADATLRQVPAILVTSRDAPEDRERGRTAGAAAYVVKGEFDQNLLLRTIARLIGGS
ncbi:MAG TPA: response regulator [Nannocystaceae bacterium]|nr:response regulator [Nannocystaceae bacterium]